MIYLGGKLNFHKMNEDMIIEQLITDIFTDHDTRTRPMAFFYKTDCNIKCDTKKLINRIFVIE